MDYKEILYEIDKRVATITLNRPETLNAFTDGMLDEWTDALERLEPHGCVLTGVCMARHPRHSGLDTVPQSRQHAG